MAIMATLVSAGQRGRLCDHQGASTAGKRLCQSHAGGRRIACEDVLLHAIRPAL